MPRFSSDGVEIAYREEGEGAPVLLVHGFASNAATNWVDTGWMRQHAREGFRAIAIDNRGHGASQKLYRPEDYAAGLMMEDARRLLDHLSIPHAHVIGYSMGARITAFLALAHPDRVASATFAGLAGNMVRPMAGTGPIAAALEAPSIADVTNATARTFRAFAESTRSDLLALAACIRGAREPIAPEMVARIRCPVLVAAGSDDVIAGAPEDLARLIPGARALVIEGRDHMKAVGDRRLKDGVVAFLREQA